VGGDSLAAQVQGMGFALIIILAFATLTFMVLPVSPLIAVTFTVQREPGIANPKISVVSAIYQKVPLSTAFSATRDKVLLTRLSGSDGILSITVTAYYTNMLLAEGTLQRSGEGTYEARLYLFPRSENVNEPYIFRIQVDGSIIAVTVLPR